MVLVPQDQFVGRRVVAARRRPRRLVLVGVRVASQQLDGQFRGHEQEAAGWCWGRGRGGEDVRE